MEGLELLCFEIISVVGTARSCFVEAMQKAKASDFEKAEQLMSEGREYLKQGHSKHTTLIQKEAAGEKTEINLILVHSEDQMMSAEVLEIIAHEMIELYKLVNGKRSEDRS